MDLKINEIDKIPQVKKSNIKDRIGTEEFSFALKRMTDDNLAIRLESLIKDISLWGKKIAEHPEIRELRHYRGLIRDFINEVIVNSHEFSRENFLDRRGRHRVYGIVRIINQDLDSLAQEILKSETNNMKILELTDQIMGLLLDMLA